MNKYRCETCTRRIGCGGTDDCPGGIPSHLDVAWMWLIEQIGCASHSDFQIERDIDEWCKVHAEVIKDIQTSAYREGYHDGEVVGAKRDREKVLLKYQNWLVKEAKMAFEMETKAFMVRLNAKIVKEIEELRAGEP
jgi:hypothetical protein